MSGGFSIGLVYKQGRSLFLAYAEDGLLSFRSGLFFRRRVMVPSRYSLIDPKREFGVDELLGHWGAPLVEFDKVCHELFRLKDVSDSRPAETCMEDRYLRQLHTNWTPLVSRKSVEMDQVLYFRGSSRIDCPGSFIGGAPGFMKGVSA